MSGVDYLSEHVADCQCKPDDPRYATLCELLAAMAQEKASVQTLITRLEQEP